MIADEWPEDWYQGRMAVLRVYSALCGRAFTMFTLRCGDCGTELTRKFSGSAHCHECGWPYA